MNSSAGVRPESIFHGVALIIAAALVISVQDVLFKFFSSELTLWQIFALRGILALPMLLIVIAGIMVERPNKTVQQTNDRALKQQEH